MPGNDDAGERRSVEIRARTVDEAVARGLVRLGGLSRSEVKIEVLEEPRAGILGFGSSEAAVRLTTLLPGEKAEFLGGSEPPVADAPAAPAPAPSPPPPAAAPPEEAPAASAPPAPRPVPPPAPAPERPKREAAPVRRPEAARKGEGRDDLIAPDAAADAAVRVVRELVERLGYDGAQVTRSGVWLPDELSDDQSLVVEVEGPRVEDLLGNEAEALQAMQFVARLILAHQLDGWVNLLVDVNGDRARRVQELVLLARQSAELVERDGRPVSLPPMTAYERRVVHLALSDHPVVATQSIGTGEWRKVTVRRIDQLLPEL